MTVFATISPVSHARHIGQRGTNFPKVIMGKEVDPKYYAALKKFMERVSDDRAKALADTGASNKDAVGVFNETGRRYDKILIAQYVDGVPKRPEVQFFVDRDSGEIYGPKSAQAPNEKRYFGTVFDAHLWDWSAASPKPYDEKKAGVKSVRSYGDVAHYERI